MDTPAAHSIHACHTCGLVQRAPDEDVGTNGRTDGHASGVGDRSGDGVCQLHCSRCNSTLGRTQDAPSNQWSAALCLAAMILYIPAMMLPILQVQRFGHVHSSTIWSGVVELLAESETGIAMIVLFCSIIAPIGKLLAMLFVTVGHPFTGPRPRVFAFRVVQWLGRWGMVDVLLVAVLVAAVKLGSVVEVSPGAGAIAFTGVVVCSLLASAVYHPHAIWDSAEQRT